MAETKTQIQKILYKPSFKEKFFMKVNDNKTEKISKVKYEKKYDESWSDKSIIVLPPLTKEL